MGKEKKKGQHGGATNYISRGRALARLQLPLGDFRKLCIFKSIYPRQPTTKNLPSGRNKTYYLAKDIQFLAHEPLLATLRALRAHRRKLRRARARGESAAVLRALSRDAPRYSLDAIVRERYPTFPDALADLDDALNTVCLFAALPASETAQMHGRGVPLGAAERCERLRREFCAAVAQRNALVRVFVSIKGIYFQAVVDGVTVTWLDPFRFAQNLPADVDYRVMNSFLEIHETLMRSVNMRLFLKMGWSYPPRINGKLVAQGTFLSALLKAEAADQLASAPNGGKSAKNPGEAKVLDAMQLLKKADATVDAVDEDEAAVDDEDALEEAAADDADSVDATPPHATLFKGLFFFFGRETPVAALELVVRSCGGLAGWDGLGSPYPASDTRITHCVVDRPKILGTPLPSREYVQPQWVFDCLNAATLLPVALYAPGATLPPHLSPFVDNEAEGYVPKYQQYVERIKSGDLSVVRDGALAFQEEEDEEDEAIVEQSEGEEDGEPENEDSDADGDDNVEPALDEDDQLGDEGVEATAPVGKKKRTAPEDEERNLAKLMMTRKEKKLYEKIEHGVQRKSDKAGKLEKRRKEISKESKKRQKK
mmetsp:Transcript_18654/g.49477  ORF Transcript_18654/g.49477 Transcript_18654/m.49477 type:complete len:597 (-) Transcript_18654:179-1969(-)